MVAAAISSFAAAGEKRRVIATMIAEGDKRCATTGGKCAIGARGESSCRAGGTTSLCPSIYICIRFFLAVFPAFPRLGGRYSAGGYRLHHRVGF